MTLEQRVEALEFKVEFPEKNGISFTINKDLAMKAIQRIGSNVSVNIDSEMLANIPYSEELTPELTLEGYNQRAKKHAQNVVAKIIETAQNQAAFDSNVNAALDNAKQNLISNTRQFQETVIKIV